MQQAQPTKIEIETRMTVGKNGRTEVDANMLSAMRVEMFFAAKTTTVTVDAQGRRTGVQRVGRTTVEMRETGARA